MPIKNRDKKEKSKCNKHARMQRGANFTIVSSTLVTSDWFNIKFSKSLQSSMITSKK